jgi:hypothetical protein
MEIDTYTTDHLSPPQGNSGSVESWPVPLPIHVLDAGLATRDTPISLIGPLQGRQAIKLAGQLKLPNELCTSPEPVKLYSSLVREPLA